MGPDPEAPEARRRKGGSLWRVDAGRGAADAPGTLRPPTEPQPDEERVYKSQ